MLLVIACVSVATYRSNAMFNELAERLLMSPLAETKHTYVSLAIVIFSRFLLTGPLNFTWVLSYSLSFSV